MPSSNNRSNDKAKTKKYNMNKAKKGEDQIYQRERM